MGDIFDAMNRASGGTYEQQYDPKAPSAPDEGARPGESQAPAEDTSEVLHKFEAPPESPSDDPGPPDAQEPGPPTLPFNGPQAMTTGRAASRSRWGELDSVDDRLVSLTEPSSLMCEEYRSIRTSILARWDNKRNLVHTITSATPQEGKTITTLNLGLIFAELHNRRTIVVEADLRLPQFRKLVSLPDQPGLVSLLEGQAQLSQAIVPVGHTNLDMITAGRRANDRAVQLLHSGTMVSLLQQLRQRYDHVIIDTPPVVELADAGILGAMSDDVLMIVRMGRTPEPLVEQAIRTLASYNAPVAGLVATDRARYRGRYYYKYGYRYRYRYRYTDKQAA